MSALCKITPSFIRCLSREVRPKNIPGWRLLSAINSTESRTQLHKPTDFEKRVLVWTKAFPSLAEVPEEVSHQRMKKSKDIFRIKANIAMILGGLFVGYLFMRWGRRDAAEGNNIHKWSQERHKEHYARMNQDEKIVKKPE